jgi:hypothetical protein
MPEQEVETGELNKAEEVLDVILPAGDEAAEVVYPGEEPFHFPATTIATELPSILSLASALPVRRDQFDLVLLRELFVERVRVVGLVADEPGGQFVEKASSKNFWPGSDSRCWFTARVRNPGVTPQC